MKLSLGFSPCPNDTFIFDALIHHKIDTEGLEFEVFFDDVETLNLKAFRGELDVTKLSFHAFAKVIEQYVLLDSGSALGFGVGPLLIANEPLSLEELKQQPHLKVGIPGINTTANFLLGIALPELQNKELMVFSAIENALIQKQIDLGLIIHENRFTYQDKGLKKIIDLGEYWEKLTQMPIPLGGIMIKRELPQAIQQKVNRLIQKSVAYAFANPDSSIDFISAHAQEMSREVMRQHINLYVNEFSVNLGEKGRQAVQVMFDKAVENGIIKAPAASLFLN
ncbi:MAG: 1,4-dihydroxy-6-naphthoate synthase [Sphingobacteriaceae bacterium]